MIRVLALIACLVPAAALAQSNFEPPADMRAAHDMMHGRHLMQGQHMMYGQPPRQRGRHPARTRRVRRDSGDRRNSIG